MSARHTLVQITDLHLVPEGRLLRDRLDTFDVLARALATVERAALRPAALLFTGDLADSGEPGAYRRLRELVDPFAARLRAPALYVMGNHDDRAALREHLLGLPPTTEPLDYSVRLGGLRVVALDTTVPGRAHGEISPDQLRWLAAVLAHPAPDGTVLALHHPPLPSPSRLSTGIELHERGALAEVLDGSDVRLILGGHTHVLSAGALAGIPVWTGGTSAFAATALPPDRGEQVLLSPTASRVDLYDDTLIVSAAAIDAEHVATLTPAQVDAMLEEINGRPSRRTA